MKLVFIRHGDPDYAHDSLTEKGFREAELLSERVRNWKNVTAFYVSPLGRAQRTAEPCLQKSGRTATTLDWLREFFYPIEDAKTGEKCIPWDFMPADWTKEEALFDKDEWSLTPRMRSGEVGAHYRAVCDSLDELLLQYGYRRHGNYYIAERDRGDTLVFFCHFGVSMVMLSHLLNVSPVVLWQGLFCAPTSVTVLCSEQRENRDAYFRAFCVGDTSHLRTGGEPASASGYFADPFLD